MTNLVVEVAVSSTPVYAGNNDGTLSYRVAPELSGQVQMGSLVLVPLGKRRAVGVVVAIKERTDRTELKDVAAVLVKEFLPPEMIEIGRYVAGRYVCPLAVAVNALMPPAAGRRLERRWCWLPSGEEGVNGAISLVSCLPAPAGDVAEYLSRRGAAWESQLLQLGPRREVRAALEALKAHGLVRNEWSWRGMPKERRLPTDVEGAAQAAAAKPDGTGRHITLDAAQLRAATSINAALGRGGTFLLYGVTGSGKTEVYLSCAAEALARGYQVMFLVPEHSLIPQMVTRINQRLEAEVAVVHGELADGERAAVWERARIGKVRVIVGTRAALFTPMPRLGLIVVDEEHAGSYKQDTAPRYDAREVAIKRGQLQRAVVVLGSATPSTEIFYLAGQGKIHLLELPQRAGNAGLPRVEIVDLRAEFHDGHHGILSRRLVEEINGVLTAGRQAILFLNRRGYAPYVLCRQCGHVPLCRHCAVALTYHRDGTLRCHYCGYIERAEGKCPVCGGNLSRLGSGTQRVEEEVRALWPGARILRADRDTTAKKGQWEKIYRTFAGGEADILIGTQTITKGMDFPGVTLVGVVNADLSLYQPDFRARERTFQLLTQVAGRAGRRDAPGTVVIQTYNPQDPAIALAAFQDYQRFYAQEIAMRRRLGYPPFVKLVRLGFTGSDEAEVIAAAHEVAELISNAESNIQVLGPAPGYPSRLKDLYRWQLMLKVPGWSRYKNRLTPILAPYIGGRRTIRMIVDVGPINPW
ncbi:primosomal protein N' [Neomoorella humiferrea]|uniref:replication restart helicase PriA n=1 Tax=Neomoorella humiferrea TaxID=676965 RepID=UPI003D93FF55